jgi:hypothetical protein
MPLPHVASRAGALHHRQNVVISPDIVVVDNVRIQNHVRVCTA